MATERSDRLFEIGREAVEKYDYFLAGLSAALTAYLAQSFKPNSFAFVSPVGLEGLSLLLFCFSFIAGVKRVELANYVLKLNQGTLRIAEELGQYTNMATSGSSFLNQATGDFISGRDAAAMIPVLQEQREALRKRLDQVSSRAGSWAVTRDILLAAGFLALVAARLWGAIGQS